MVVKGTLESADISREHHKLNREIRMRTAILAIFLGVVSSGAEGAWYAVSETDTFTTFADPTTISKAGNTVKMWDLLDYKKMRVVEGIRYMSQKSQSEYNCQKELTRPVALYLHSGIMGGGELVYNNSDPDSWQPVAPGSV